jgi:hypothetical protein
VILLALGSGFGLASVSPWPNTGASVTTFTVMTAIWLIIVQWVSSGLGGYLTGRLRTPKAPAFPAGVSGCACGAVGREPQGTPISRQPAAISLWGSLKCGLTSLDQTTTPAFIEAIRQILKPVAVGNRHSWRCLNLIRWWEASKSIPSVGTYGGVIVSATDIAADAMRDKRLDPENDAKTRTDFVRRITLELKSLHREGTIKKIGSRWTRAVETRRFVRASSTMGFISGRASLAFCVREGTSEKVPYRRRYAARRPSRVVGSNHSLLNLRLNR